MSLLLALALSGLPMQDVAPHPSSQAAYQAPVIRPFEPGRDFGREPAQGDAGGERYRRPLEAPVTVEAYVRSYEYTPTGTEASYEQGVTSAEMRADQAAGRLDGTWRIVDAAGTGLYDLVLSDAGVGPAEGGWRGASHGRSGPAISDGATLTLEGAGMMTLERAGSGWRGVLTADGRSRPVRLVRPD
jgi:hypothetical protein